MDNWRSCGIIDKVLSMYKEQVLKENGNSTDSPDESVKTGLTD